MRASEYQNIFNHEETHWWYQGMKAISLSLLRKYLPARRNSVILDVGCGTGEMMKSLAEYGEVYGVDRSTLAISFCRKRGLKRAVVGKAEKLPFKKANFHLVTSFDLLYIKEVEVEEAVSEAYRVLKKGGVFLVRVPAFEFLRGAHDLIVHTARRFTKRELAELLVKNGFELRFISYANTFLFPLVLLKRKLVSRFQKGSPKSDIAAIPLPLNRLLEKVLWFEALLMRHISFPFGVSLFALAVKK